MARIRSIHPDACDSSKLARLTDMAERLFWRLLTNCDDYGRCEYDPEMIWARCVYRIPGWDANTVAVLLEELELVGLVSRFDAVKDGTVKRALQVELWGTYQHPKRKVDSKFTPLAPHEHPNASPEFPPGVGVEKEGECEGESVHSPQTGAPVDNLARIRALKGTA